MWKFHNKQQILELGIFGMESGEADKITLLWIVARFSFQNYGLSIAQSLVAHKSNVICMTKPEQI